MPTTASALVLPAPDASRWAAVAARDAASDGRFVYGVTSTGVYCRPSCPSRRPRPDRVAFFDSPDAAEAQGFRACRRCRPRDAAAPGVAVIARVRDWIDAHPDASPSLARLGRLAGLSPWHLQRRFSAIVGLTPREYAAAARAARFRTRLREGTRPTDAVYEAGYGSASRAYEAAPAALGMTPGEFRQGAPGADIRYAIAPAGAFGHVLVAATTKGVCAVSLGDPDDLRRALAREYPRATLADDPRAVAGPLALVLDFLRGARADLPVPLDVRATAFQRRVWKALQAIPAGTTRTYADVARAIGRPTASRAVARACASNRVALAIPCHRVVARNGGAGGYRWGVERKALLLQREVAPAAREAAPRQREKRPKPK